ncbi:MFS transporter [Rhodovulum sp. 12E13]|uniref:multidrug effflux MFS transporter n=1 Tax=Rhodovulum sp. 12E13 TaxID=2203891 RepID=UPI000E17C016|nr:multidrug effflux MFS transporter [Rhodovulum sp. 12E13]RDC75366.1 MFS transporter [Rhodovulum sp. 12E13]
MTTAPAVRFLDRASPPHILTLVLMAGIAATSMSIFLPSLPAMAAYFGADYAVIQLSVSLYLAVTGLLQLVIGPLSDRYGRRPVTLTAMAIFLVATVGCLLAPTVEIFLAFRMLQGAVVVGIVLSRAIVRDMVPEAQAASMIGYVTMGMALVPMVVPMVGGALDELFGWHAVFVFLLLFGAAVTALLWADQGETATATGRPMRQQVREYPELLASPRFWGYAMAAAFASGAFFAFLGGAPYAASEIYGMSPFWTGVAFGAPAIGYFVGNFLSGRFSARVGINRMMLWGSVTVTCGMTLSVLLALSGLSHPAVFFTAMTTVGAGNGMMIPNATSGMLSVRPHLAGTASGLGGAIMIGGGAAMSVLAGVVLEGAATSLPLQALMLGTSAAALSSTLYVIARTRRLAQVGGG